MRRKYVFAKKVYISILTTVVLLLTTVATTFAWVGVLENTSFEEFNIGVRSSQLQEYSIEISLTGEKDSFSESLSFKDIKKEILINCGYDELELTDERTIDNLFSLLDLDQCTTLPNISGGKISSLGKFYDLYGHETNMLFKFDIYVSVKKTYDVDDSSDFKLDVYLGDGILSGHTKSHELVNSYTYPDEFENPLSTDVSFDKENNTPLIAGDLIKNTLIDSASSARIAFEKYEVVDKGHPEYYDSLSPKSAVIYETDLDYPYYNKTSKTYSFGGILKDEVNLATCYYNSTEWTYYSSRGAIKSISLSDEMWNARGVDSATKDLIFSNKTNHLIDSTNIDEQIGVNQMMKVTCYFWYEGWDADCIPALNGSPVDISLIFNMSNDDF